jgi:hypothetical protein
MLGTVAIVRDSISALLTGCRLIVVEGEERPNDKWISLQLVDDDSV